MRILLHTCCAPCLIYPLSVLRIMGYDVTSYFYNPNIHPYKEFSLRYRALETFSRNCSFSLLLHNKYELDTYLRSVVLNESERCRICLTLRLENTTLKAKTLGFNAFSTTLLYSKYQKHDLIAAICRSLSAKHSIKFIYHDFRVGWQYGVDISRYLLMYRQKYCGCIYSEYERYLTNDSFLSD
jgi:epoxyqueuosine reductase